MQEKINELCKLLKEAKNIIIVTHNNPDGDAIGSSLALFHYLNKINIKSTIITPNNHPSFLNWASGIDELLIFEDNAESAIKKIKESDLIFTLDFNSLSRCGEIFNHLNLDKNFIMIDHHQNPESYAKIQFSEPSISSTCELVYNLIDGLGDKSIIDKKIASCLYLGMMTDTGCFQYNGVTSKTYEIISYLLKKKIDQSEIYNNVYNNSTESKLIVLGKALGSLKVLNNHKTSFMHLTKKDLIESSYKKGDSEGIVNYGLTLSNINFTAIFIEDIDQEDLIKISFRSKIDFPCNKFAEQYFEGGGHINAAGGKFIGSIEEAIELFKEKIKEFQV
jgi:phosphoesterase RecJ-like protein